ncbi:GerAB/ArcD/ProY family transporter [Paenibacillus illinoisensis]|uniref:Spore germination protein n=1 Tax=Paenibacillus illinoisensis TaxID=59845 RepID=A0A2W0C7X5_9BACL|nr:spore germination protein [Paenibacillus illinoisensis]PYY26112.1 Spore germination protein [Paenibacillus illinoisensis]
MGSKLTVRQAITWFVLYQIGSAYLVLPAAITSVAKQDAWLSVPISLAFHLLLIPLYTSIVRQMKGRTFVEYLRNVFGPLGGTISIIFIFAFPFLECIMTLRNLGDFVTTSIMPETPYDAIYFIMLLAVYFAVRSGPVVIGRCAEILIFFLLALYLLVRITLFSDADFKNLLPVLENGLKPVVLASINLFAFPYLEAVLFLFFAHHFPDPKKWRKSMIVSALISGAMYFFMVMQIIAVISAGVVADLTFPTFLLIGRLVLVSFFSDLKSSLPLFGSLRFSFDLHCFYMFQQKGLQKLFVFEA